MFGRVKSPIKKPLWKRCVYTAAILVIIQIVSQIPTWGINQNYMKAILNSNTGLGFISSLTGTSMERMSVLALGITPYITAQIILQLLSVVIPAIEEMQRDGESGKKKHDRLSYIITFFLTVSQSIAMGIAFGRQGLFTNFKWYYVVTSTITWTCGVMALVAVGKYIEKNLVGNGTSLILAGNIISRVPSDLVTLYENLAKGKSIAVQCLTMGISAIGILALMAFVVVYSGAERNIKTTNSRKVSNRYASTGDLPLRLSIVSVVPIIFASTLFSIPSMVTMFTGQPSNNIAQKVLSVFNQSNWFTDWIPSIGVPVYFALIIFFSYFYAEITFNPMEVAHNLKKSGAMIQGIRPGKPTEDYIKSKTSSVVFLGSLFLVIIALLPCVVNAIFHIGTSFSFFGTSLIIMVNVVYETYKTVKAEHAGAKYRGTNLFA